LHKILAAPARAVHNDAEPSGVDEFMSTLTTDYLDLVERLPAGASLWLRNVGWEDYEHLLTQMDSQPGHRVTYDCGRLIIMSPSPEHEDYKEFIYSLIRIMAVELGIVLESRGSATFKSKRLAKGAEPDTCFYVQNAKRIIGQRTITLGIDPPPDVAVEIDTTNESLDKFKIYAALGVPEIWRYDGEKAHFYQLSETSYQEIQSSVAFPLLTAEDLTRFLEQSKAEGQTAAVAAFLKLLRGRK
jgi:Uma2 family endonuclease